MKILHRFEILREFHSRKPFEEYEAPFKRFQISDIQRPVLLKHGESGSLDLIVMGTMRPEYILDFLFPITRRHLFERIDRLLHNLFILPIYPSLHLTKDLIIDEVEFLETSSYGKLDIRSMEL